MSGDRPKRAWLVKIPSVSLWVGDDLLLNHLWVRGNLILISGKFITPRDELGHHWTGRHGIQGAESLGKLELITWQTDDLVDLGLCLSLPPS